jgi:hypothetical protein
MKEILLLLFVFAKEQVLFGSIEEGTVYCIHLIFSKNIEHSFGLSNRTEVRVRLASLLQRYVTILFMLSNL